MSQIIAIDGAARTLARRRTAGLKRSEAGSPDRAKSGRLGKRVRNPEQLPALNWPRDLFVNDPASLMEDGVPPPHVIAAMSDFYRRREALRQGLEIHRIA